VKHKEILILRQKLGLTQEEFAEAIGTHRVTVARWETGVSEPKGAALKNLRELKEKGKNKGNKRGGDGWRIPVNFSRLKAVTWRWRVFGQSELWSLFALWFLLFTWSKGGARSWVRHSSAKHTLEN
jgi:transcriptional regulator with XRE-family HTH domain